MDPFSYLSLKYYAYHSFKVSLIINRYFGLVNLNYYNITTAWLGIN